MDLMSTTQIMGNVGEFLAALAVLIGIGFAVVQLRQSNLQRKDHAAVDIVRTVQTQEVRRSVRKVLTLPENADPSMVTDDDEMLNAALAVDSACEMWGCMVFEGVVDHKMLDRMVGGWIRGTWTRLHVWVEQDRLATGNVNIGEWWQWVFEVLEADPDAGKNRGAHITYRGAVQRPHSSK